MLSWIAKLLLTSTAIAPVLLTYAWVAYRSSANRQAMELLAGCILLVVVSLVMLKYAMSHLERINFQVTTAEAADRENIGFLLLYMLPLFTSQFSALNWRMWTPAALIFAVVVGAGYSYHFNPLLGIMKWHFYKVGTKEGITYVLITKKQLRNATDRIVVGQLTEYLVIDMEGK